jgi:hypothetical protein
MLVPNCIFRSNGAAVLLSNKASESWWVAGSNPAGGRALVFVAQPRGDAALCGTHCPAA